MDLLAQYNALLNQAEAIEAGASAVGRDITAEELTAIEGKLDEAKALKAKIDVLDRLNKAKESTVPAPKSATPAKAKVESVEPAWEKDPMKGFASDHDFLMQVRGAAATGYNPERMSDNLRSLYAVGGDGQNTYNNQDGGFLVPQGAVAGDVLQIPAEFDPIAGRTTNVPLSTTSLSLNARVDKDHSSSVSGGLQVYRRKEEASLTSSKMKFEQVKLDVNSLFGLTHSTEEMLSDSSISIAAIIQAGYNDEFASRMIDERLNGTGAGEFLGVHNSPALVTVAKETSQTADTVNFENVIKMRARVWGYNNSVWLANHDVMTSLVAINDGTNHIYIPSAREDVPDMLLGRPIFYTENMETLGDANDIGCYNFSQYLEGTYQPTQSAESMHVRFSTHERSFKFWTRNAGTPWWSSALTPKKGANTLSPFVTLAERA
jgi:HK97 family phage major capsid protein